MQFTIEQLDKRHNGWLNWRYRLRIGEDRGQAKSNFKNFHQLRSWMIEHYGISTERDSFESTFNALKDVELFDPRWCWHIDRDNLNRQYIYVENREMLSHITLKWL
jgi:hypothetical protein